MPKDKILQDIKIDKIGYQGVGIATAPDGRKIIIKGGVLPNSIVDLKIIKNKKDHIQAQVLKIKEISKQMELKADLCEHYFFNPEKPDEISSCKGCGGCKRQILPYDYQLQLKQEIVQDSFRKIADKVNIGAIVPAPIQDNYRNKIEFSFGKFISHRYDIANHWVLGFHKQGEFSKVIDVENCKLISSQANNIYLQIKNILKQSGLPTYDQKTHEGVLRHLVIREGFNTGQIMVNLVISDNNLNSSGLTKKFEQVKNTFQNDEFLNNNITTFLITSNNGLADIVKSQDANVNILRGDGFIYEKLIFDYQEAVFRISPFGFFQTNTYGAQTLFTTAAQMLGPVDGTLLDLYCGAGSIGISFAKMGICDDMIGIEVVPESIYDAKYNAEINSLQDKTYFVVGKAEQLVFQDEMLRSKLNEIKAIVVDPPREGLHPDMIKFLVEIRENIEYKLLYISCNPVTMSRDISLLLDAGMSIDKLKPVDMFPHTNHIECIGVLNS